MQHRGSYFHSDFGAQFIGRPQGQRRGPVRVLTTAKITEELVSHSDEAMNTATASSSRRCR